MALPPEPFSSCPLPTPRRNRTRTLHWAGLRAGTSHSPGSRGAMRPAAEVPGISSGFTAISLPVLWSSGCAFWICSNCVEISLGRSFEGWRRFSIPAAGLVGSKDYPFGGRAESHPGNRFGHRWDQKLIVNKARTPPICRENRYGCGCDLVPGFLSAPIRGGIAVQKNT